MTNPTPQPSVPTLPRSEQCRFKRDRKTGPAGGETIDRHCIKPRLHMDDHTDALGVSWRLEFATRDFRMEAAREPVTR